VRRKSINYLLLIMLVPLLLISTNVLPGDLWQMAVAALCLHVLYYRLHTLIPARAVAVAVCVAAIATKGVYYYLYPFSFSLPPIPITNDCSAPIQSQRKKYKSFLQRLCSINFSAFANYWNEYETHGLEDISALLQKDPDRIIVLVGRGSRCAVDLAYLLTSPDLDAALLAPSFWRHIPGGAALAWLLLGNSSPGQESELSDVSASEDDRLRQCLASQTKEEGKLTQGDSAHSTASRCIIVLPGGLQEAYGDYDNRFKLNWSGRSAEQSAESAPIFARVLTEYLAAANNGCTAAAKNISIVPYYTRNGDNIYYNSSSWYTSAGMMVRKYVDAKDKGIGSSMFKRLLFAGCGVGFFLFPRPVKLDTYFSPVVVDLKAGESASQLGKRAEKALQHLITNVNMLPKRQFQIQTGLIPILAGGCYGLYVLVQNFILAILFLAFCVVYELLSMNYYCKSTRNKEKTN
jgi:hypothetical protein